MGILRLLLNTPKQVLSRYTHFCCNAVRQELQGLLLFLSLPLPLLRVVNRCVSSLRWGPLTGSYHRGVLPRSSISEEDGSDVCSLEQTEPEAKSCQHRTLGDTLDSLAPHPESSPWGRVGANIKPEPELGCLAPALLRCQHLHPRHLCRPGCGLRESSRYCSTGGDRW